MPSPKCSSKQIRPRCRPGSLSAAERNNMNVGGITEYIEQNIVDINDLIVKVRKAEEDNKKTLTKFAVCASENEMLFNDLYSFAYEIKAIFKELLK